MISERTEYRLFCCLYWIGGLAGLMIGLYLGFRSPSLPVPIHICIDNPKPLDKGK